jgi:hypothetical protein
MVKNTSESVRWLWRRAGTRVDGRRRCNGRSSHVRDRTRRGNEEMVPHDPASLGSQATCVQSLQSGPLCPLQKHAVSNLFPPPASRDEGAFLPMPGVGLHDVAMGDQRSAPIARAAAQGIAPVRAAQGILWFGRHALHVYCAVMCSGVAWRRPPVPKFRHCLGRRRVDATL